MLVLATVLGDFGRSLREGFFMFWETLWPLVFGFALAGAVQAFVAPSEMHRVLGDHRPAAVTRASGLGVVSSSCSYAATAMAKSLFQKGADFTTSMIFMFASTNLVVELGIVLVVLLGWQFAAAEFIGGPIMIVLLAVTGTLVIGGARVAAARRRVAAETAAQHDHGAMVSAARQTELERAPWHVNLRSRRAWGDAAAYTMADLSMVKRELVLGYLIAGFLATLVPNSAWNAVFLHGHGIWTSIENVIVGPFIAIISFVCSIGNVPLAAALWYGGIRFGGVIAFIFADLITLPLLFIYAKYYGIRLTLRLLVWFWAVMAVAGLAVEGLFSVLGLIPEVHGHRIVDTTFHWNYTTVLNIVFLALFAYLYWLYRHRGTADTGETAPEPAAAQP
ncbi:MAG TPA: permease [Acidimicrobiia bacterium]